MRRGRAPTPVVRVPPLRHRRSHVRPHRSGRAGNVGCRRCVHRVASRGHGPNRPGAARSTCRQAIARLILELYEEVLMRRFQALLIAAGLAAAPAGAAAHPSGDPGATPRTFEKFAWSAGKGRLGVMVMGLTPELRKHFGAAQDRGVIVARVEPGTPAAAAGVAVGDIIVEVRGRKIDGASDVVAALTDVTKGQSTTVQLMRSGKPISVQVTLTDEPAQISDTGCGMRWLHDLIKSFGHPDSPMLAPCAPGSTGST